MKVYLFGEVTLRGINMPDVELYMSGEWNIVEGCSLKRVLVDCAGGSFSHNNLNGTWEDEGGEIHRVPGGTGR